VDFVDFFQVIVQVFHAGICKYIRHRLPDAGHTQSTLLRIIQAKEQCSEFLNRTSEDQILLEVAVMTKCCARLESGSYKEWK
jgi:hypothetical protein